MKVPAETAPPRLPARDARRRAAALPLVEEWGFDAVTPVEVSVFPDTTLVARRRARLVLDEPRHGRAAPRAPRRRGAGARSSRAAPGGARAARRSQPVWNRGLVRRGEAARAGIPVFAVGGIRTAAEVRDILDAGDADMVGIGRPFYAEPDLAARILAGDDGPRRCRNSNRCVAAQMLGMKGVCYNPDVRRVSRSD